jgi:poly [ADP-ribose] polymerase
MAKRYAYLVMVDGTNNHNKFYEIKENADGSLDCNYGRVDKSTMHHHYAPYEKRFDALKQEKEAKGYTDVTSLHAIKETNSPDRAKELSYAPVEDPVVQAALERMIEASRMFMKNNYTIQAQDVTPKMINEAENDIRRLSDIAERKDSAALWRFNEVLTELFTDIPRAMNKVQDNLAQSTDDFDKIIIRENQMLQNLKSAVLQCIAPTVKDDGSNKTMTVLEARGLTMRQTSFKEEDRIIDHLGKDYQGDVERRFIRAFAVENLKTRENYEQYKKDRNITPKGVKLFYHGSKVENWYSIMSSGMSLNPDAKITAKMFGQGLYFAPECRKALNYMDCKGSRWNNGQQDTGYTAIYSVALGKVYEPNRILGRSFTFKDLPDGCDSVFASKRNPYIGLANDEYIVYSQDACTIKYMLEMSHRFVRDLDFNIDRKAVRDAIMEHTGDMTKKPGGFVEVPVYVEQMSQEAQGALSSRFGGEDISTLTVTINPVRDRIEDFTVPLDDGTGTKGLHPDLTNDDLKFLLREIKKNFAEGNYEWSQVVKLTEQMKVGEKIKPLCPADTPDTPEQNKKKDEKEIT